MVLVALGLHLWSTAVAPVRFVGRAAFLLFPVPLVAGRPALLRAFVFSVELSLPCL